MPKAFLSRPSRSRGGNNGYTTVAPNTPRFATNGAEAGLLVAAPAGMPVLPFEANSYSSYGTATGTRRWLNDYSHGPYLNLKVTAAATLADRFGVSRGGPNHGLVGQKFYTVTALVRRNAGTTGNISAGYLDANRTAGGITTASTSVALSTLTVGEWTLIRTVASADFPLTGYGSIYVWLDNQPVSGGLADIDVAQVSVWPGSGTTVPLQDDHGWDEFVFDTDMKGWVLEQVNSTAGSFSIASSQLVPAMGTTGSGWGGPGLRQTMGALVNAEGSGFALMVDWNTAGADDFGRVSLDLINSAGGIMAAFEITDGLTTPETRFRWLLGSNVSPPTYGAHNYSATYQSNTFLGWLGFIRVPGGYKIFAGDRHLGTITSATVPSNMANVKAVRIRAQRTSTAGDDYVTKGTVIAYRAFREIDWARADKAFGNAGSSGSANAFTSDLATFWTSGLTGVANHGAAAFGIDWGPGASVVPFAVEIQNPSSGVTGNYPTSIQVQTTTGDPAASPTWTTVYTATWPWTSNSNLSLLMLPPNLAACRALRVVPTAGMTAGNEWRIANFKAYLAPPTQAQRLLQASLFTGGSSAPDTVISAFDQNLATYFRSWLAGAANYGGAASLGIDTLRLTPPLATSGQPAFLPKRWKSLTVVNASGGGSGTDNHATTLDLMAADTPAGPWTLVETKTGCSQALGAETTFDVPAAQAYRRCLRVQPAAGLGAAASWLVGELRPVFEDHAREVVTLVPDKPPTAASGFLALRVFQPVGHAHTGSLPDRVIASVRGLTTAARLIQRDDLTFKGRSPGSSPAQASTSVAVTGWRTVGIGWEANGGRIILYNNGTKTELTGQAAEAFGTEILSSISIGSDGRGDNPWDGSVRWVASYQTYPGDTIAATVTTASTAPTGASDLWDLSSEVAFSAARPLAAAVDPSFVAVNSSQPVGPTLSALGSLVEGFSAKLHADYQRLMAAEGAIKGLQVSLGTFPSVNVTAGQVMTPEGKRVVFEAGSISLTEAGALTPAGEYHIFVDTDDVIRVSATPPTQAVFVLGKVALDGPGTAFASLDASKYQEQFFYNLDGNLSEHHLYTGPVRLRKFVYTYDVNGRVTQVAISRRGSNGAAERVEFTYDGNGYQTTATYYVFGVPVQLLDGSAFLDGSLFLNGLA